MSDTTEPTRRGKIARLPQSLRDELCLRMLNGEPGSKLLPWLNAQPACAAVVAEQFGGEPITDSNLSNWRAGGFEDWRKKRERIEHTKALSLFAVELAKAGGKISEGAAAIAGGKILETLEKVASADLAAGEVAGGEDDGASSPLFSVKTLTDLTSAVATLRHSDQQDVKLAQNERKLGLGEESLALLTLKFHRETADLFRKFYADARAKEIMESGKGEELEREALIEMMFGARPGGRKQYEKKEAA